MPIPILRRCRALQQKGDNRQNGQPNPSDGLAARLRRAGDAVALEPIEHAFHALFAGPPDRRIISVKLRTLPLHIYTGDRGFESISLQRRVLANLTRSIWSPKILLSGASAATKSFHCSGVTSLGRVIAAKVTPAIAETVKKQIEAGIDCIGDGEF